MTKKIQPIYSTLLYIIIIEINIEDKLNVIIIIKTRKYGTIK